MESDTNVRRSYTFCALLGVTAVFGQYQDQPRFDRDHVLAYGSRVPRLLTRGQFVSIYGYNLAPRQWCGDAHQQREPYPSELCGVRVLVGGHPAGLMYVGPIGSPYLPADQINFQTPAEAPSDGLVPIEVCVGAICSNAVTVEFTSQDILLRVEGKAYFRMPLWIQVEIPMNVNFSYPFDFCLWDFGGYDFEIRRNGQPLTAASKPECRAHKLSARFFLSGSSRLPLHLIHPLDAPGTYEVRLSGPLLTPDLAKVARIGRSDWIQITVLPHSDADRDEWLHDIGEKAAKIGGRQPGDLIASLLAWPDERALATLLRFLPPPIPSGWKFGFNGPSLLIRCIAPDVLAAFPEAVIRKYVSDARLKELRGPYMCP